MKKKLLAMAIAGAFAGSGAALAGEGAKGATVNGFIDTTYTITDDFAEGLGTDANGNAANSNEGDFHTEAEVDLSGTLNDAVSVRVDLDVNNPKASDNVSVEQAYGAWKVSDAATVLIGTFNNPIGYEGNDRPDLSTISHSLVWNILDHQTSSQDNNNSVEGAAVAFGVGPANVVLGLLNDLQGAQDSNSFAGVISGSPLDGLDLELGFVTQEDYDATYNSSSAEGVTDFNVAYGQGMWKVWLDYLTAGAIVDSAYSVGGMLDFGNGLSATLRFDNISYDSATMGNIDDNESTTLAVKWHAADNLELLGEWRNDQFQTGNATAAALADVISSPATNDGDRLTLEAIYTF